MGKDIFEVLTEYAVNERLDDILLNDIEYQKIQREMDELIEQFHELSLPKEQNLLVDRLVSSHTESGCCYGRIAYRQGMRDSVSILLKMGLIKDGKMEESA